MEKIPLERSEMNSLTKITAFLFLAISLLNRPAFAANSSDAVGNRVNGFFSFRSKLSVAFLLRSPYRDTRAGRIRCAAYIGGKKLIRVANLDTCDDKLINEGDLDGDGLDELSIYSAPLNGCTYLMTTYTFEDRSFRKITPAFLVPTACKRESAKFIEGLIFVRDGRVFALHVDPNDEDQRFVPTEIELKIKGELKAIKEN